MPSSQPRRAAAFLLAFATIVHGASATWSVVAVDTLTREVCVSSATCIENFNLKRNAAVIVPGLGGAKAQSFVDTSGANRQRLHAGILAGEAPADILAATLAQDAAFQTRQYGIATFDGAVTFTGTGAGLAHAGVAGTDGRFRYAIQGNILTGDVVVLAAEAAFLATDGDVSARVMAAMEAAAALGGDGRCSCGGAPTSCGTPPPNQQYSSYTAFLALARIDDPVGPCNASSGCATGPYELDLNVISSAGGVEPVVELRTRYDAWRQTVLNRPHPGLSRVEPQATALVADGRSSTFVRIRPINIDGVPLSPVVVGGVELALESAGPAPASMGPIGWHGAETFGFVMTAGDQAGQGTWSVTLIQGAQRELLGERLELRVDPLAPLHVGCDEVGADEAADVPFHVNLTPGDAGSPYLLVGTTAGTLPPTPFPPSGIALPLAWSPYLRATVVRADSGPFVDTAGALDANGRRCSAGTGRS
jgi:uncharacterized Ntn-hydrolase superfamily protein